MSIMKYERRLLTSGSCFCNMALLLGDSHSSGLYFWHFYAYIISMCVCLFMNNKFWWYALSSRLLEHWFVLPISMLKAFKKATESLEKLMDVMREELPDTMVVVRLLGMEISDLNIPADLFQFNAKGLYIY